MSVSPSNRLSHHTLKRRALGSIAASFDLPTDSDIIVNVLSMGAKPHAPFRSRKKDVIVTTALCTAVFGAALFLQAQLYAKCRSFTSISSVGQLQHYVQTFIKESGTPYAAGNLVTVSKQLRETIDNSTRLVTRQQEVTNLQVAVGCMPGTSLHAYHLE